MRSILVQIVTKVTVNGYALYDSMPLNSFLSRMESAIVELEKLVLLIRQMCFDGNAEASLLRKKLLAQSRMLSEKDQEIAYLNAEVDLLLQAIRNKDYTNDWYASDLPNETEFQKGKQFTSLPKLFGRLKKLFH
uniref:LZ_Tnp_IS66 domain-containing protein n=1 Tax=Panagrellus redivivus TaxID=6233 RepID=A0A7E4ZQV0_PANRE